MRAFVFALRVGRVYRQPRLSKSVVA
jgi:hypothetical protein